MQLKQRSRYFKEIKKIPKRDNHEGKKDEKKNKKQKHQAWTKPFISIRKHERLIYLDSLLRIPDRTNLWKRTQCKYTFQER